MTNLNEPIATGQTRLSEAIVKALPIPPTGNKVHYFAGAILQGQPAPRGFGVRVTAAGIKSFVLNYRIKSREYRYTIGRYPEWSALRAVRHARELRQRIDRGENPIDDRTPAPKVKTVAEVLDDFMSRYVRNKDRPLRSADEYESAFRRLVIPAIGKLTIYDVRRSHVVEMLDKIEDNNGAVMADRTLAYLRKAFNWHVTRDDRFVPPIVRGMTRTKAKQRARERILTDDEVRIIWPKLSGNFGSIVKLLLLTAQRRNEIGQMLQAEITDGIWVIPAERYKSMRANLVPLSADALAIIEAQAKFEGCDYVFTGRTHATPFSGFGKAKATLDKVTGVSGWTLHDLRRTAKTLMVRAGVRPDISERVLGHVIPGVEGVLRPALLSRREARSSGEAGSDGRTHSSPATGQRGATQGTSAGRASVTKEQPNSTIARYVGKRLGAERNRRVREGAEILARAYIEVLSTLNGDISETFLLFDKFTRIAAKGPVPTKRRSKANPELDARILAAGDAAPPRQRKRAVADAAGANTPNQMDAARKRYDRLRAERDLREKMLAKLVAAVRRKSPRRAPQPLFESIESVQPDGSPVGDKYSC